MEVTKKMFEKEKILVQDATSECIPGRKYALYRYPKKINTNNVLIHGFPCTDDTEYTVYEDGGILQAIFEEKTVLIQSNGVMRVKNAYDEEGVTVLIQNIVNDVEEYPDRYMV